MVERPKDLPATARVATSELRTPFAARGSSPRVSLLVYHADGAEIVPLAAGKPIVIGRVAPADVVIADQSLSREHAKFELVDGAVRVEDLGSTNGTLVRGAPIDEATVHAGDEVQLGAVSVTVHELTGAGTGPHGLLGHDRFRQILEDEIVRARFFHGRVSLVMVHAPKQPSGHLRFWFARVQALLRPVDRVGLFSEQDIEIVMPDAQLEHALDLATKIAEQHTGTAILTCGVGGFPEAASSAEELLARVRAAAVGATPERPVRQAADEIDPAPAVSAEPIARSPAMQRTLVTAERVARGTIPVLVLGETGSGKEVLARHIHASGPRRAAPLVCVNCAAIPSQLVESTLFGHERGAFTGANARQKGVFEAAAGGTVLLDEIGELPEGAQAALLRVLETKHFSRVGSTEEIAADVRVLSATHRDLEAMVAEGRFREDLFYRLNAITLRVPPLRERPEDFEPLVRRILAAAVQANGASARTIDDDAMACLASYAWPGNVRELRNVIDRAVVIAAGASITLDDLPERLRSTAPRRAPEPRDTTSARPPSAATFYASLTGDFRSRMEQIEADLLRDALDRFGWNKTETARQLQMPIRTLVHKLKALGIRRPERG